MVDRQYDDPRAAALYDVVCGVGERADFAFYLPLVLAAGSVLDVGCGTGSLLRLARERGHRGRLVGVDPAAGMLAVARGRSDVEWLHGDVVGGGFDAEFDLVVMTGHAFQALLDDDEILAALAAIRRALVDGGTFAFETRNPAVQEWEQWTNGYHHDAVDDDGVAVRFTAEVDLPVEGDLVTFTSTYQRADWDEPLPSRTTLRFAPAGQLDRWLTATGFSVAERYGDWDHSPLGAGRPEIITLARAATARDVSGRRSTWPAGDGR